MKKTVYHDDFNNIGIIKEIKMLPYKGAKKRKKAFRLACATDYDSLVYFVSVYKTEKEALARLCELSCGTFKEV